MGTLELTTDEKEIIEAFRLAKMGHDTDIKISVKDDRLAEIVFTNTKIYERRGSLREAVGERPW